MPAVPPATFAPSPVAFHEVSQHDGSEIHRPVRKRRHEAGSSAEPAVELQLVETQSEKVQAVAFVEDELPRRTKPRRRRSAPEESGPLQLVETRGDTLPPAQDPTGGS